QALDHVEVDYDRRLHEFIATFGYPVSAGTRETQIDEETILERWSSWSSQGMTILLVRALYEPEFGMEIGVWCFPSPSPIRAARTGLLAEDFVARVVARRAARTERL
ncbi:MAG: hypothetical protein AAGE52_40255, partial [Myxococcota bacterium]